MNHIKLEQIRILHRLSLPSYVMTVGVSLTLAYVYRSIISDVFLIGWVSAVFVVLAFRYFLSKICLANEGPTSYRILEYIYGVGTLASGCCWAALALKFDSSWPAIYQLVLSVSMAGLIAGAVGTHSSYFVALVSFYSPILVSLAWVYYTQSEPGYKWLCPLIVLFWAKIHITGRRFSNMLKSNIEMQHSLAEANKKLERLSRVDSLTQLQNRSALDSYLDDAWRQHRASQKPISVAMVDVDMFKAYNDQYGHIQGDQCLARIAEILRIKMPEEEGFVGRYGGEEFIIVLPGIEKTQARAKLVRVREAINAERLVHSASTVADHITVSIGLGSMVPSESDDWLDLIECADTKLYLAKETGRNRIVY